MKGKSKPKMMSRGKKPMMKGKAAMNDSMPSKGGKGKLMKRLEGKSI